VLHEIVPYTDVEQLHLSPGGVFLYTTTEPVRCYWPEDFKTVRFEMPDGNILDSEQATKRLQRAGKVQKKKYLFGLSKPPKERRLYRLPQTLYHTTFADRVPSILKHGLVPGKGESTFYARGEDPDVRKRTYLAKSPEDVFIFTEGLMDSDKDAAILEVRVPPSIPIYREVPRTDPVHTVYVRQTIPPQYIKVVYTGSDNFDEVISHIRR